MATTNTEKHTMAIVLPKSLINDILSKKTDKLQTTTDFVKMALIRQFKLDATAYPAGSKGKARKDYSPKIIADTLAAMTAALTKGDTKLALELSAELSRMNKVNANIEAARKAKAARKASEVKAAKKTAKDATPATPATPEVTAPIA